ncbi:MAG: ribosomal L7Ae/L30e/S12e/Gadd45 family protein [Candidatus Njordarchaeia archaeon]
MSRMIDELSPKARAYKDAIIKELAVVRKTGSLVIGYRKVMRKLYEGTVKLIIIASDMPEEKSKLIKYLCKISNIPYIIWPDDVKSLGEAIGRPHIVSVIGIEEVGTSGIMQLLS